MSQVLQPHVVRGSEQLLDLKRGLQATREVSSEAKAGLMRSRPRSLEGEPAQCHFRRPLLVEVTSYNEWGEGTQIEPAKRHRSRKGSTHAGYTEHSIA